MFINDLDLSALWRNPVGGKMLIRDTAELLAAFSELGTSSKAEETTVWGSNILSEYLHVYSNLYFQGLWWRTVAWHTKSVPSQSLALVETLGFLKQLPLGGQKDGASFRMWPQEAHRGPITLGCSRWELEERCSKWARVTQLFCRESQASVAKVLIFGIVLVIESEWLCNWWSVWKQNEKRKYCGRWLEIVEIIDFRSPEMSALIISRAA